MLLEYKERRPEIAEECYIAPNAVIRGDVTVKKGAAVLFGAVITSEGGPVEIGENCVVMEQAVIRGTPKHPARLGHSVLVGPHSHLTGCTIEEESFIATGSAVFNGALVGKGSEVRINGVVHVNTVLPPGALVPIGWVAVGDPARILPAEKHEEIWELQRQQDFPGTVWGMDRSTSEGERIRKYARALQRHRQDRKG